MGRVNRGSRGEENSDDMKMIASKNGKKINVPMVMRTVSGKYVLSLGMNMKLANAVAANQNFWRKSCRISVARPTINT